MRDGLGAVQTVLVLGGGSDIGLCVARGLVRGRTRTVILAARRPERLGAAVEELRSLGADRVDTVRFDADDLGSHQAFVDEVFDAHSDIDVVVFAFGVLGDQAAAERNAEAALSVIRVNFVDAVSVMVRMTERLRRQGHGTIVVFSSVAGERPRKSNFVYGSSKAAIDAFSQGLGDSLQGTGVGVLVVRPGFVKTKMTTGLRPAPLAATPEQVADAIVGGLRRGDHTVWVPRELRFVMWGLRLLPRVVFRRLNI